LSNRVTLITVASSGIGADLARVFARHGHRVALVAPARGPAERARRGNRRRRTPRRRWSSRAIWPARTPPTSSSRRSAKRRRGRYPRHNAGFGLFGQALDLDRDRQLEMIAVNIRALTSCRCASPTA